MQWSDLTGKRVVVWGAGREGTAAAAECERRGIHTEIITTDGSGRDLSRLLSANVVIKSPGIAKTSEEYLQLVAHGVEVTGLTALWIADNAQRVIGVTGTKGKSTTASLIQHVLVALGVRASLVGNVGTAVTEENPHDAEVAVVEVSSYQASDVTVSPRIAVLTSLYAEHLPWHGGYDKYIEDKLNLFAHGVQDAIIPEDLIARVLPYLDDTVRIHTPYPLQVGDVELLGDHNLRNASLALAAIEAAGYLNDENEFTALEALHTFTGLPHRLEAVPTTDGRLWVDDSLATAPEAVVQALRAYAGRSIAVIIGGEDRGLDFTPLVDYISAHREVTVIPTGPAGERVTGLRQTFTQALAAAKMSKAEVILLSPGAPSFDEFGNYEQRSGAFIAAAKR